MPLDPEPHHHQLQRRLKDSFAPTYLTAVSVIQGVALADLGTVVLAGYARFTLAHWLLVGLTFLLLIVIWNAYTNQSVLWSWLPDFRDAVIPFLFGAVELVLNRAILLSLPGWLASAALLSGLAMLANWYSGWRAREEPENAELLSFLRRKAHRFQVLYSIGLTVALLLLAAAGRAAGLEASAEPETGQGVRALLVVLLAGAGLGWYVLINIRTWNEIVAYARSGRMPEPGKGNDLGSRHAARLRGKR